MVDIQCATAENRQEKKKQKEETTGVKPDGLPITMGGHKIQDGGGRHFEKLKYRHISAMA